MKRDSIFEAVKEILAGPDFLIEAEQITANASFREDLAMDSLDVIEFTVKLEDAFFEGEEIPAEVSDTWQTVGDVVAGIEQLFTTEATKAHGGRA